jgi:hypothetical protein
MPIPESQYDQDKRYNEQLAELRKLWDMEVPKKPAKKLTKECAWKQCRKSFHSKDNAAKYCSRSCANSARAEKMKEYNIKWMVKKGTIDAQTH